MENVDIDLFDNPSKLIRLYPINNVIFFEKKFYILNNHNIWLICEEVRKEISDFFIKMIHKNLEKIIIEKNEKLYHIFQIGLNKINSIIYINALVKELEWITYRENVNFNQTNGLPFSNGKYLDLSLNVIKDINPTDMFNYNIDYYYNNNIAFSEKIQSIIDNIQTNENIYKIISNSIKKDNKDITIINIYGQYAGKSTFIKILKNLLANKINFYNKNKKDLYHHNSIIENFNDEIEIYEILAIKNDKLIPLAKDILDLLKKNPRELYLQSGSTYWIISNKKQNYLFPSEMNCYEPIINKTYQRNDIKFIDLYFNEIKNKITDFIKTLKFDDYQYLLKMIVDNLNA